MGLSGRPYKLSSKVPEGGLPSPEESRIVISTEDSVESVLVTVADAQEGDAGLSGRVRQGVLAPSS